MLTAEEAKQKFQGVVIPLATIFKEDGGLDVDSTAHNVQWILERGAGQGNTIFLAAGSGGDFTSMNIEERKQVIKTVVDVAHGRVPIIAGGQSTDMRTCIELCQFCEELGVDAVQMAGPYYFDGRSGDTIEWFEELSRHTQATLAVYNHFYSGAKFDMPLELVDRLLDIPHCRVVKWAAADLGKHVAGIRRYLPRAAVVDNSLLAVLGHVYGSRAWISHVPNFYPEHSWKVGRLMEAGRYEEAQRVFDEFMDPYFELVSKILAVTAGEGIFVKVGMEAAGLPVGRSRPPSRDDAVPQEVRRRFRELLARVGAAA